MIQGWFQPNALPIDDVLLEPLFDRQICQRRTGSACLLGADAFEKLGEFSEGVIDTNAILITTVVVDQISADGLVFVADLHQRKNLGRADDGSIHARFTAVMQEHRVEVDPCRRRQTETHIADTEHHMNTRKVLADHPDRINRGSSIKAVFLDAG